VSSAKRRRVEVLGEADDEAVPQLEHYREREIQPAARNASSAVITGRSPGSSSTPVSLWHRRRQRMPARATR
jgi:hypothetical protein